MKRRQRCLVMGSICLSILMGCQRTTHTVAKPKDTTPTPKPTPPPITATTTGMGLSLFDEQGRLILGLQAESAGTNPNSNENTIVVFRGNATLYQKGVATATMTADKLTANRQARTVVASGNVVTKSLTQKGAPTVKANRMVWDHDKNLLTGDGNVILTAEPAYTLYARKFTADTRLSQYHVAMSDTPATGTF